MLYAHRPANVISKHPGGHPVRSQRDLKTAFGRHPLHHKTDWPAHPFHAAAYESSPECHRTNHALTTKTHRPPRRAHLIKHVVIHAVKTFAPGVMSPGDGSSDQRQGRVVPDHRRHNAVFAHTRWPDNCNQAPAHAASLGRKRMTSISRSQICARTVSS